MSKLVLLAKYSKHKIEKNINSSTMDKVEVKNASLRLRGRFNQMNILFTMLRFM